MGNAASSAAASTPDLQSCLTTAVGGNDANVALPSDLLYQITDVKPYNLDIHVTPAAITYPNSTDQVAGIVACAAQYDHKVQARSGGHSYGNYCLGGANSSAVVIDMKNFQQFSMDESTWIATVGAGTLLEDVTDRMHDAGSRVIAKGVAPQVGIGGHATIGGLGPQGRTLGTAADQIVEAEVVLANSSIIRASKDENPDVFFAIKGAGASFGVVTEFKFQTSPEPGEMVQYSYNITVGAPDVLAETFKAWNKLVSDPDLSRKFASILTIFDGGVSISGTFFGGQPEFDALNLRGALPDVADLNVTVTNSLIGAVGEWANDFGLQITGGIPASFYSKSLTFTPTTLMTDDAIDALFAYLDKVDTGSLIWFIIFDLAGGAINDVPLADAAYSQRDTLYFLQSYAVDIGSVGQKTRDFLDGVNSLIADHVPGVAGAYPGYVDPALADGQQQYWGPNLERLEKIKAQVDPNDLFHNPQSVKPASS
ncbi:hypothetical protein SLS56_010448 [Neofusicoccum ribis]|uniref:FAD-binding PCMH-type domain-containing protein n=1 Tax=Neofusicoccum ribis TaxID=45134 RepID=A0ABR3SEF5_9PEZI